MELRRGFMAGELELRRSRGRKRLRGRFPYGKRATISAGGNGRRPQKEEFAPHAFSYAVEDPARDIHLLVGHSFDQPLASKMTETLSLQDTAEALTFEAEISAAIQEASWWLDFWAAFNAGLMVGLSPGFRIPPPEAVPNAEKVVREDPSQGNALVRIINAAILFELSLVTRPAYQDTEVQAEDNSSTAQARSLVVPEAPTLRHVGALRWR